MKPVFQQIIDQQRGDCIRACVATLLNLEPEDVPNFAEAPSGYSWIECANHWLAERGLALFQTTWLEDRYASWFALNDVYCIFSVPSQLFPEVSHAVVGRILNGDRGIQWEVVHDPNPGNKPYSSDTEISLVSFLIKSQ